LRVILRSAASKDLLFETEQIHRFAQDDRSPELSITVLIAIYV